MLVDQRPPLNPIATHPSHPTLARCCCCCCCFFFSSIDRIGALLGEDTAFPCTPRRTATALTGVTDFRLHLRRPKRAGRANKFHGALRRPFSAVQRHAAPHRRYLLSCCLPPTAFCRIAMPETNGPPVCSASGMHSLPPFRIHRWLIVLADRAANLWESRCNCSKDAWKGWVDREYL